MVDNENKEDLIAVKIEIHEEDAIEKNESNDEKNQIFNQLRQLIKESKSTTAKALDVVSMIRYVETDLEAVVVHLRQADQILVTCLGVLDESLSFYERSMKKCSVDLQKCLIQSSLLETKNQVKGEYEFLSISDDNSNMDYNDPGFEDFLVDNKDMDYKIHDDEDNIKDENNETRIIQKISTKERDRLKCDKCDYSTNNHNYLNDHVTGGFRFQKCPWCEFHVPAKGVRKSVGLGKHITKSHLKGLYSYGDSNIFTCLLCEHPFKRLYQLEVHLVSTHETNIQLHCGKCPEFSCHDSTKMLQHVQKHDTTKTISDEEDELKNDSQITGKDFDDSTTAERFTCPNEKCNYSTSNKLYFEDHISGKFKYRKCPWCDVHIENNGLTKFIKMGTHIRRKHLKISHKKGINNAKGQGLFPCLKCDLKGKKLNTLRCLRAHLANEHQTVILDHCPQCNFSTKSDRVMLRHLDTHTTINEIQCTQCSFIAKGKDHLNSHVKYHHKPEICTHCDLQFANKPALHTHNTQAHPRDKKPCEVCGKFIVDGNMNDHMAVHNNDNNFSCQQCDFKGKSKAVLYYHMKSHDEMKYCEFCTYKTPNKTRLVRHFSEMHSGQQFPCDQCQFITKRSDALKNHMNRVHLGIGPEKVQCEHCKKSVGKHSLQKHISAYHTEEKKFYKCPEEPCDFMHHNRETIKHHKRKVHDKINFPCEECNYTSAREGDLKKHKRKVHLKERFSCDKCDYKSSQQSYIKIHHMEVHQGINEWPCTECDFVGTKKKRLDDHVKVEHRGKGSCKFCNFKSPHATTIKRHMKTFHRHDLGLDKKEDVQPTSI